MCRLLQEGCYGILLLDCSCGDRVVGGNLAVTLLSIPKISSQAPQTGERRVLHDFEWICSDHYLVSKHTAILSLCDDALFYSRTARDYLMSTRIRNSDDASSTESNATTSSRLPLSGPSPSRITCTLPPRGTPQGTEETQKHLQP